MKCGQCKWFDGEWLDDDGTGRSQCCIDPPVWVGPSPVGIYEDEWVEWLEEGWQRPMVGVAARGCSRFEEAEKRRWWEK